MSDELFDMLTGGGSAGPSDNTKGPAVESRSGSDGPKGAPAGGAGIEEAGTEHRGSDAEATADEKAAAAERGGASLSDATTPKTALAPVIDQLFKTPGTQQTASSPAQKGRDYTGLSADEVEMFKNMNNKAYESLRPLYDRYRKGEFVSKSDHEAAVKAAQTSQRYEDHEEGYTLSSSYRETTKQLGETQQLIAFAEDQLKSARAGEKFSWFNRDEKGNYSLRNEQYDPSPHAIAELQKWIDGQYRQVQSLQSKIDGIKGEHTNSYKGYSSVWSDINSRFVDGSNNPAFKAAVDKQLAGMFPASYANRPEAKALAAAAVIINSLLTERGQKTYQAQRKNGAPAASELSGATGNAAEADKLLQMMMSENLA